MHKKRGLEKVDPVTEEGSHGGGEMCKSREQEINK